MRYKIMKCIYSVVFYLVLYTFNGTHGAFLDKISPFAKFDINDVVNHIRLLYYYGNTADEYITIKLNHIKTLFDKENFDKEKITVFYSPGYIEPINANTTVALVNAYLSHRNKYNIMQIDWTKYSVTDDYLKTAIPSIKTVGKAIAKAIDKLVDNGLDTEKIHLVGHSLGAHIVGTIGRNLKNPVPLIVGLDPAGPGFAATSEHFSSGDAQYTIAIHTDIGVYGTSLNDADFVLNINGGIRNQPGCEFFAIPFSKTDFCSHQQSVFYWADIIKYPGTFTAIDCDSFQYLRRTYCDKSKPVVIGPELRGVKGIYYLRTNVASPYGMGEKGI